MLFRSNALALALAASACLLGASARAQPSSVQEVVVRPSGGDVRTQSETVTYADLDLGRDAGARALLVRITGAARRVCGPAPETHESAAPFKKCVDRAVDHAVTEVNRPTVNALHGGG